MNACKTIAVSIVAAALLLPAEAKPMMPPSLEEAAKSEMVVVAQYGNFTPFRTPVTYFDGVMGHYLLYRVLKGPQLRDPNINVAYAFHDGSACLEEAGWKFSEAKMPAKNSMWILFLDSPKFKSSNTKNAYSTYRGDFGRLPATEANIARVEKLLK